jgi:hypothetical protein
MPISLPQSVNVPSKNLGDYSILICGPKKIGKTSLAAEFTNSFIAEFEPGNAKALPVRYLDIYKLKDFDECLTLLEHTPNYCSTLVIDDVPTLADLCKDLTCKRLGIEHPSDGEYGKGWDQSKDEFSKWINRIQAIPNCGKIYTAHTVLEVADSKSGKSYSYLDIAASKACKRKLDAVIQLWAVMDYNEAGERVLIINGNDFIKAGNNLPGFKGINGAIPLGKSAREGYENLMKAYTGQLTISASTGTSKEMVASDKHDVKKRFVIKSK